MNDNIIKFSPDDRRFVRFFRDYVICDWCFQPTRGRVYEETQTISCGVCKQPLLEIEEGATFVVTLEDDEPDGNA